MNVFTAYGRISNDIELRYTDNQMAVAKFSIAVNRQFQKDKKADFFKITAFGKTAENIEKYFMKGDRIVVRCRAQQESYTNKDGQKVNTINFILESFDFVETKAERDNSQKSKNDLPQNVADDDFVSIPDGLDEELPFS